MIDSGLLVSLGDDIKTRTPVLLIPHITIVITNFYF